MDSLNFEEYLSAINVLFSILTDPSADGIRKFRSDYFPYPPGTIEFLDEEWYVVYRVSAYGNVQVAIMRRIADLLPRLST